MHHKQATAPADRSVPQHLMSFTSGLLHGVPIGMWIGMWLIERLLPDSQRFSLLWIYASIAMAPAFIFDGCVGIAAAVRRYRKLVREQQQPGRVL